MFRKAQPEDYDILLDMFQKFYKSEAVAHDIPMQYHVNALHELFSYLSLQRCYLIEDEGTIVGYALLSLKFTHDAGPEIWLEELFLENSCRGKGLGTEFLNFLIQEAEREHFKRIRLEVEPHNDKAAALYSRIGFKPIAYNQMGWEKDV